VLKEAKADRRVAVTPDNAAMMLSKGFGSVVVESGAGVPAGYTDEQYIAAGATIGNAAKADVVMSIAAANPKKLTKGATAISMIRPGSNPELVKAFQDAGVVSLGLDCVPRISRAQVRRPSGGLNGRLLYASARPRRPERRLSAASGPC